MEKKINIADYKTANEYLIAKHGAIGTPQRDKFNKEAISYVYGEILKEKRIEKKITQEQLAKKLNKNRTYITRIEKGETDLQLSNFMQILNALGLSFKIE